MCSSRPQRLGCVSQLAARLTVTPETDDRPRRHRRSSIITIPRRPQPATHGLAWWGRWMGGWMTEARRQPLK